LPSLHPTGHVSAAVSPSLVLTDIEGTTTPIAFVHDVLFPYARAALPVLIGRRNQDSDIDEALSEVERLAPGEEPLAQLLAWMDADAKIMPLKALQGLAWRDGYRSGQLHGTLYPDVAPALRAWKAAGIDLAVYSSGSEQAQRLLFGHSTDGDLGALFSGFFDTRVGAKREPGSYAGILQTLGLPPSRVLFLSDVVAELDAAARSGLVTCQLVRPGDKTVAGVVHPVARDFGQVATLFGLLQTVRARVEAATLS
jgi:enolase-phosphatase E1